MYFYDNFWHMFQRRIQRDLSMCARNLRRKNNRSSIPLVDNNTGSVIDPALMMPIAKKSKSKKGKKDEGIKTENTIEMTPEQEQEMQAYIAAATVMSTPLPAVETPVTTSMMGLPSDWTSPQIDKLYRTTTPSDRDVMLETVAAATPVATVHASTVSAPSYSQTPQKQNLPGFENLTPGERKDISKAKENKKHKSSAGDAISGSESRQSYLAPSSSNSEARSRSNATAVITPTISQSQIKEPKQTAGKFLHNVLIFKKK